MDNEARWDQEQARRQAEFQARDQTTRGEQVLRNIGYAYRGAENLLAHALALPRGEAWVAQPGEDSVEGSMLRVGLADLALLPRLRLGDRTLEYSVSSGVAGYYNDARVSCEQVLWMVGERTKGRDPLGQINKVNLRASLEHEDLSQQRVSLLHDYKITNDAGEKARLIAAMAEVDLALADSGINVSTTENKLEGHLRALVLSGETVATVRDSSRATEVSKRVGEKKRMILRVEEATRGVGVLAHLLGDYLGAKADLDSLMKVALGPEAQVSTNVLNVMALSDHLNVATTVAMREVLRLVYRDGDPSVTDSRMEGVGVHKDCLTTASYTLGQREKFFADWENVVASELEARGIGDGFRLASDAVSLATVFLELYTMGGMAFVRDRKTGKKLIPEQKDGGSGSFYDTGDQDLVKKTHQLRDRKGGEAASGRKAPRPGVIKGLAQELQYSYFQYTEAKYADGSGLGMSIIEALTREPRQGEREYTAMDLAGTAENGAFQSAMYFAFRAMQIHNKLDELPAGRINPLQELGGGPEKLVQDMIDTLLALHKAMQVIPFGSETVRPYWGSYGKNDADPGRKELRKKYDDAKKIETQRNMILILSDFYRAATAANTSSGGYSDNANWRGFMDQLKIKIYERVVSYTHVMTPQQFWLAIDLGTEENNAAGGVLTVEMVNSDNPVGEALREILSQDSEKSSDSMLNLVTILGYGGTERTSVALTRAMATVINLSANHAKGRGLIPEVSRTNAGFSRDVETTRV